jgi:energy-coupling factor transporter transmembrane protein EcfT
MEGRGYQRGPRTYLRELKFSRSDYTALLVVSAVLIGVEALRFIPL